MRNVLYIQRNWLRHGGVIGRIPDGRLGDPGYGACLFVNFNNLKFNSSLNVVVSGSVKSHFIILWFIFCSAGKLREASAAPTRWTIL